MAPRFLKVCLAALAAAKAAELTADPDWPEFRTFVEKYSRQYATEELEGRFAVFKANLRSIEQRSARSAKATFGVNRFADLTAEEFKARHMGYRKSNSSFATAKVFPSNNVAASSIDWRTKGAVTPVKDQGQCGSCWAFSATEQIESDYFLRYNTLPELSPQQIVSCDTQDYGCDGGDTVTAFQYVTQAGGQESESAYPYTSGDSGATGSCRVSKSAFVADVAQAQYISQAAKQEPNMLQQIALSPMSICVEADLWQSYTGGIITASDGCGTNLDHCVQVVGYNAQQNYWLVRNSWGTGWGEAGYIWVEQGSNVCGIAEEATIVTPSQPAQQLLDLQV